MFKVGQQLFFTEKKIFNCLQNKTQSKGGENGVRIHMGAFGSERKIDGNLIKKKADMGGFIQVSEIPTEDGNDM